MRILCFVAAIGVTHENIVRRAGTGNGHIARARAMANALSKQRGVAVDFLFSGREADRYFRWRHLASFDLPWSDFRHGERSVSYVKNGNE